MSPFRSLAALTFVLTVTGCAADFAEEPEPTNAPSIEEQSEAEEGSASADELPAVDTDGTTPAKKAIWSPPGCKKNCDSF